MDWYLTQKRLSRSSQPLYATQIIVCNDDNVQPVAQKPDPIHHVNFQSNLASVIGAKPILNEAKYDIKVNTTVNSQSTRCPSVLNMVPSQLIEL